MRGLSQEGDDGFGQLTDKQSLQDMLEDDDDEREEIDDQELIEAEEHAKNQMMD